MKIKQVPSDFIVKETSSVSVSDHGPYTYFKLKKTNYTTNAALQAISKITRIPRKFFGYAGNKDRHAITEQICSVKGRISNKKLPDIIVEVIGKGQKPISLGDLDENHFEIIVRDIEKRPTKVSKVVNFFDTQRFGRNENNHKVGKFILQRKLKEAVDLIDNDDMLESLQKQPKEYIGALRKIPRKILSIYIHAYQSYIWNKCVAQYLEKCKNPKLDFPIVGYSTEFEDDLIEDICLTELKKEEINQRDFITRQLPELCSEGTYRKIISAVNDLEIGDLKDDELNSGKKKIKICFSLNPGCYATLVIKNMFDCASMN